MTAITATGDLWYADLEQDGAWHTEKIPSLHHVVQAPASASYVLCADGTVWRLDSDGVVPVTGLPTVRSIAGDVRLLYLVVSD